MVGDNFEDRYYEFVMADDEEACIGLLKEREVATDLTKMGLAILIASRCCQVKVVDFLINAGANLDYQDKFGATPLHSSLNSEIDSAIQDNEKVLLTISKKLIDAGASESIKNDKMQLPRDIAAAYGKSTLRLYDAISWNDYHNELTFDELGDFCISVLNDAGYNTQLRGDGSISVAKSDQGHDYYWNRFFLHVGCFFKYRRDLECLKLKLLDIAEKGSAKFIPKYLGKSKWKANAS